MLRLIFHRNLLLPLAIALGFVYPRFAVYLAPLILPVLALAMAISAVHIPNEVLKDIKRLILPALAGLGMTYGVLGSILILSACWGPFPEKISLGLILIGVAPPAVAVMPFTAAMKGDLPFTLAGVVVAYLGALLIIPGALFILMGDAFYDFGRLVAILAWVVLAPIGVSRLIIFLKGADYVKAVDGPLTNLSFFLVLYAIVGLNRDAFFTETSVLVPLVVLAFFSTFVLGETVNLLGKWWGIRPPRRMSLLLMATLKNQGVAGGIALSLFESEAALPSAIYAVFMMLSFVWFSLRFKVGESKTP